MNESQDANDLLLEHYRKPRNWGSFPDREARILTGIAKKELYNDFLALSFKWEMLPCLECSATGKAPNSAYGSSDVEFVNCSFCLAFGSCYYIEAVKHVSIGCSWLIAASSWFSGYVEHKRVEEILSLKEADLMRLSGLPRAREHCAALMREAIFDALDRGFHCLIDPA